MLVMAVGLRGGSGGVLPSAALGFWCELELTAPECVLARCRKGFVEPGVTGAPVSLALKTAVAVAVAVEGVWAWL